MRELLLLRHAKSSWNDPSLDDIDRPLSRRGKKAAPAIGREMTARGWVPDRVLVSTALRTRQTWALVAVELGQGARRAIHERALYMASADRVLAHIRRVPDATLRLLVVGHNPGLEDLASALAGRGSHPAASARLRSKFPTAALARFEFEGTWSSLGYAGARLTDFLRPKDLAARS